MVLLENDVFLTALKDMFNRSRQKGSVYLTMKRYDGRTKPRSKKADKQPTEPLENLCLIRAVHKSKKLSTVVHSKDVNKFQSAYCSLLKLSFDGLKRSKKSKSKATFRHRTQLCAVTLFPSLNRDMLPHGTESQRKEIARKLLMKEYQYYPFSSIAE